MLRTQLPLKQGLRLHAKRSNKVFSILRTQLPLKQGLRRLAAAAAGLAAALRTQLPLKQGLRLFHQINQSLSVLYAQNPTSTKTRIKTLAAVIFTPFASCSEPNFH